MSVALWGVLLAVTGAELVLARVVPLRRFPKLIPWFSSAARGLLALSAAAAAPETPGVVLLLALLAVGRLGTAYLMAVVLPAMRQSVVAVGVAEKYFESFRWADYTSRRFGPAVAVMTLAQAIGDAILAATGVADAVPPILVALLAVYALIELGTHLMGILRWNHNQAMALAQVAAGLHDQQPRVVMYSAALAESVANLEQWLPSLEASGESAYVITRELASVAPLTRATSLPVVFVKALGGLEELIPDTVQVALYVDTSTRNNHLLRIDGLSHVQLHHGESDKASSSSRLLRLYDHHFVAGGAAVDRLAAAGIIAGPDGATIVGRPIAAQLERRAVGAVEPTVLYAPTWEGYHEDNAVSSLPVGVALVTRLLANLRIKTVVRPHPLTGRVDKSMAAIVDQLARLVAGRPSAAMSTEPSATAAIDALQEADVLVTDVSSMFSDFLHTGRPVIVVDVAGLGEAALIERYPTLAAAYVVRSDLSDLDEALAAALGDDPLRERRTTMAGRVLGAGATVDFTAALAAIGSQQAP